MERYELNDGDGDELVAGLQGDVIARQVAQEHADRLGRAVYLSRTGTDDAPTEFVPTIHIATSVATPSDVTDERGAVDVNVTVTIGTRSYDGEVTLAPQQYDGRMAAFGDAADYWVSSDLLAELYAACERATGAATGTWLREVLRQIEAVTHWGTLPPPDAGEPEDMGEFCVWWYGTVRRRVRIVKWAYAWRSSCGSYWRTSLPTSGFETRAAAIASAQHANMGRR